ncbi:MAG: hypothetical protein IMY73_02040 [Bacteroidetes bacterium]|nr:hypothetical protein [Bacteroidota bacterium]
MRKSYKIAGISILSLIGVVLIAISVVLWVVLTPEKLTPIVKKQASKMLNCEVAVDTVNLTFFSTFPKFCLKIDKLSLVNSIEKEKFDTIAYIGECSASINLSKFLFDDEVELNELSLKNVGANIYTDSLGNSNLDVILNSFSDEKTKEKKEDTAFEMPYKNIDLEGISIENLNVNYLDDKSMLKAILYNCNIDIDGNIVEDEGKANLKMYLDSVYVSIEDSIKIESHMKSTFFTFNTIYKNKNAKGTTEIYLPHINVAYDNVKYLKDNALNFKIPFDGDIDKLHFLIKKAILNFEKQEIEFNGWGELKNNGDIGMDMAFETNKWDIPSVLTLVPAPFSDMLKGIDIKGSSEIKGTAKGIFNDSLMPKVDVNLKYNNGNLRHSEIPCDIQKIELDADASINLNKGEISVAKINKFTASACSSTFDVKGTVNDFMNTMLCNFNIKSNLNLTKLQRIIPKDLDVKIAGKAKANLTAKFKVDDAVNLNLQKIYSSGKINLSNFNATYADTINIESPKMEITIKTPSSLRNKKFKELVETHINGENIICKMGNNINSSMIDLDLNIRLGDFMDTTKMARAICKYKLGNLTASVDDMNVSTNFLKGEAFIYPSKFDKREIGLECSYKSNSIALSTSDMDVKAENIDLLASVEYNPKQTSDILIWNPIITADFKNWIIKTNSLKKEIDIPTINLALDHNSLDINDSRVIIGESDFGLKGNISNISEYIDNKGLLVGEVNFTSDKTNITELMDMVNGIGNDSTEISEPIKDTAINSKDTVEDNPFMVPKGVFITINTDVSHAVYEDTNVDDIAGTLIIKDGVLILKQVGFTSEAAEMQLTALYRSDRRNHLFAGFDFHLLNIDIEKMIKMIPDIDTMVPMLKAFDGKAEFHFAAETYMKSNYDIKVSTLRAAAAIEGKDLILFDNDTFSTMSKKLMFSKKAKNKVDSISVEMTIFRDEIDIYPFLVSMDRWQAVLSGRHNLDMSFDYHVSVTKCPLPIRLGLDIKGNIDNLDYKLVPCKYKNLYKPNKRNVTQDNTLKLKKIISDNLKKNVK